jgi:hypothetical protein
MDQAPTTTVDLPNEMIQHIVSFIDPQDKSTCAAICATSHLGRYLATPLLYRVISISQHPCVASLDSDFFDCGDEPDDDEIIQEAKARLAEVRRLQLLCRTLIKNRKLATYITKIELFIGHHPCREAGRMYWLNPADVKSCFKDAIGLPEVVFSALLRVLREPGLLRLSEGSLVILLLLCPKLEALSFEENVLLIGGLDLLRNTVRHIRELGHGKHEFRMSGTSRYAAMSSLREISFLCDYSFREPCEGEGMLDWPQLSGLLELPRIKTLRLHRLEILPIFRPRASPHLSSLEALVITGCCPDHEWTLKTILRSCPNLRSLSIQFCSKYNAHRLFIWRYLGKTLGKYGRGLEILDIGYPIDGAGEREKVEEALRCKNIDQSLQDATLDSMGNLKHLVKLKQLTITGNALFGTLGSHEMVAGPFPQVDYTVGKDEHGVEQRILNPLSSVLPNGLQELTIIFEEQKHVNTQIGALTYDPFATRLKRFNILDCRKRPWMESSSSSSEQS